MRPTVATLDYWFEMLHAIWRLLTLLSDACFLLRVYRPGKACAFPCASFEADHHERELARQTIGRLFCTMFRPATEEAPVPLAFALPHGAFPDTLPQIIG